MNVRRLLQLLPLAFLSAHVTVSNAAPAAPSTLRSAPLATDEASTVLVWSKPAQFADVVDYRVYQDGKTLGSANDNNLRHSPAKASIDKFYADDSDRFHVRIGIQNFTVSGLAPDTEYRFTVRAVDRDGKESPDSNTVTLRTTPKPALCPITAHGAVGDGSTINTEAIQKSIDACPAGGKVVVPAGVFKTGALFLKSRMTLEVAAGATLLGSERPEDYPLARGYRLYSYSTSQRPPSLINALDPANHHPGAYTDIRIVGAGNIDGNGWKRAGSTRDILGRELPRYVASNNRKVLGDGILAAAQFAQATKEGMDIQPAYGQRRSSLMTLRGVRGLYIGGVTLLNPAFHGIMVLESEEVAMAGLTHTTYDGNNADGIEFGNSRNVMVFNNFLDTGDDCINFAAGTGQDAEKQPPMQHARIFNNYFREGHGAVVAGSHTGAWIEHVLTEDNVIDGTEIALRNKSNRMNGGGARHFVFRDNAVRNVLKNAFLFTLEYADPNALLDYKPATVPGQFRDMLVQRNSVEGSRSNDPIILVQGDQAVEAYHARIVIEDVTLRKVNGAVIDGLKDGAFRRVKFESMKTLNANPWTLRNSPGTVVEDAK